MQRRDMTKVFLGAAAGGAFLAQRAEAQSCVAPCYPQTAAELAAAVTPSNSSYPPLDIRRYGGTQGLAANNTSAFQSAHAVAVAQGGGTIFFPIGDWRGNFLINSHNICIEGEGGVGELNQTCLRPWSTGAGFSTLQIGNDTRVNRKCGIRNLVISGNNGSGGQADIALYLAGGTIHFSAHNFELMDGLHSLSLRPGGGLPVTTCWFSQFNIRTDYSLPGSRSIYLRRPADPEYLTAIYFTQGHINGPTDGYWAEIDGTGGPGILFHMSQMYVDSKPYHGILLRGGNSSCDFNDVHLDPGTTGAVIVERDDLSKNPGNTFLGTVHHGGQKIRLSDTSSFTIPDGVDVFAKKTWFGTAYANLPMYFTNVFDPFNAAGTAPFLDNDSVTGPITLNNSSLSIKTDGQGLRVKEGSNCKQGLSGAMSAGQVVVSNSSVTASSRIMLTRQDGGANPGAVYVSARSSGSSFTIRSTNGSDTGTVAYQIFEPA